MSIRLRMTMLYSTILALTLIVFSTTLYTVQSQQTLSSLVDDLTLNAQRLVAAWSRARPMMDPARPFPRPWLDAASTQDATDTPDMPDASEPWAGFSEGMLREFRSRDTLSVLDAEGTAFDLSGNQDSLDLPLSDEGLHHLQEGQAWTEIASIDDERWLIYSQPVALGPEVVGIVQVARSLADRDRSLQGLRMTLILGSTLTTGVAFGIGWVLSGVTMQPIHRITQTARQIGEEHDFGSRVQHDGPNDELGRLATTFNGMLERLQDAYQQVTHALQMQRDFVADVSHELRTPLTTIRGNLALLARRPPIPSEEREDILNDVVDETERLIRLVSDLLILARADAGRKLKCEPVPVQPLVEDVCRQARVLEPGREIACQGVDSATALADPDALKQVLLTLVDNAIVHGEGPIHVALDERDHKVTIRVQDSGPGMSPASCQRIFDRFYRGDASRSTPGFGLGLSIAKALVEAQGGTIAVEGQLGQGSTFTVTLPNYL
ncbi:MAG TPA: HAMP domain-containing sensor histidine kinase [Anaerolineae bacterium]|nr:HAMP domain-containing sensor histidine kinase [Anaerolineae bacterium]